MHSKFFNHFTEHCLIFTLYNTDSYLESPSIHRDSKLFWCCDLIMLFMSFYINIRKKYFLKLYKKAIIPSRLMFVHLANERSQLGTWHIVTNKSVWLCFYGTQNAIVIIVNCTVNGKLQYTMNLVIMNWNMMSAIISKQISSLNCSCYWLQIWPSRLKGKSD